MNTIFTAILWLVLVKLFMFAASDEPCFYKNGCMKCLSYNFQNFWGTQSVYCRFDMFCGEMKENKFNDYKKTYEYDQLFDFCTYDGEYQDLQSRYNFEENKSNTQKISLKKSGAYYASKYLYTEWDSTNFFRGNEKELHFNFDMEGFSSDVDLLYFKVEREYNTYYYDVKKYIEENQNPFVISNVTYYKIFYIALEDRDVLPFSAEISYPASKKKSNTKVILSSSISSVLGLVALCVIGYFVFNYCCSSGCACHCHFCETSCCCKIF